MATEKKYYLYEPLHTKTDISTYISKNLPSNLKKPPVKVEKVWTDVSSHHFGMKEVKKLILVKLTGSGDSFKQSDTIELSKSGLLRSLPKEVISYCNAELDIQLLDPIPDLPKFMKIIQEDYDVTMFIDQNGKYWIGGQWFQISLSKEFLYRKYSTVPEGFRVDINVESRDKDYRKKLAEQLLNCRTASLPVRNQSSNTIMWLWDIATSLADSSTKFIVELDMPILITTLAMSNDIAFPEEAKIRIDFNPKSPVVKFCLDAKKKSVDYGDKFTTALNQIADSYNTVKLDVTLPNDYRLIMEEAITAQFRPAVAIKHKLFKLTYYVFPEKQQKQASSVLDFIARFEKFTKPSPNCSEHALFCLTTDQKEKTELKPVVMSSSMDAEKETISVENVTRSTNIIQRCGETVEKDCLHLSYLYMAERGEIDALAERHNAAVRCKDDKLVIEANSAEDVNAVSDGVNKIYSSLSISTKDINLSVTKQLNQMLLVANKEGSQLLTVVGPKDAIEQIIVLPICNETGHAAKSDQIPHITTHNSVDQSNKEMVSRNTSSQTTDEDKPKSQTPVHNTHSQNTDNLAPKKHENMSKGTDSTKPVKLRKPGKEKTFDYRHNTAVGMIIKIGKGDITKLEVDAVVNAANDELEHGGGVAGAISKAAGPELDEECKQILEESDLGVTDVCVTKGYKMKCKKILHAIGPVFENYKDEDICYKDLKKTFRNCLEKAVEHECHSLAIPAISSGIFEVPPETVSKAAIEAIDEFATNHPKSKLGTIQLIDIKEEMVQQFKKEISNNSKFQQYPKGETPV